MIKPSKIIQIFESDNQILSFILDDGLPIWFLIRYDLILSILNKNTNLTLATESSPIKKSIFRSLFFAIIHSPFFIKKNQVVFFNSGVTNVKGKDGKHYFNRVTDHFFFSLKRDAVLVEDTYAGELMLPRVHKRVFPHLTLSFFSKFTGKFIKISNNQLEVIENLIKHVVLSLEKHKLNFNEDDIRKIILRNSVLFLKKQSFYEIFLKIKCPKVVFLEDASYGNRSHILLAAKKLKIPVIELQHGFINEEHIAYSLGSGLVNEEKSRLFYPDYFFSYGEFWKESMNVPSKILNIGNPYLNEEINLINSLKKKIKRKTILFISSAVAFSESIEFLFKLKPIADINNYDVIFRPHPLEISSIKERYSKLQEINVLISKDNSLYEDLSVASIIIGEISTALFESMALKDKQQFLFMSSYTKSYINEKIKINQIDLNTIDHLFITKQKPNQPNYFWEENWRENFDLELKKILK